jgi:ABC-type branched-subunit amino acid transport system substrate-binding protein
MKQFLVVALLLISVCTAHAAATDPGRAVLATATTFYSAGQYDSTIKVLQAFVKDHGKDSANEYLVPLLVEALVRKNNGAFALRLLDIYKKKFGASPFMPRMWYLQGVVLTKQEEYTSAVEYFSLALGGGVAPALDSAVLHNVRLLCESAFTLSEISGLSARKDIHPRIREVLRYYEIVKAYNEGQTVKAVEDADVFREEFPRSPYHNALRDIVSKAKSTSGGQIQVGLLAPLSGYDAEIGRQIVQGVQVAVDQFNLANKMQIKLLICDTRGSGVETARQTFALLNEHKVSLIVGPVLSQNAVVTASILVGKDAVMISPTATDDGIAELGDNIFQMNVPLGALGTRIAQYAMDNLSIKEFAIIAPLTDYGSTLSRKFRDYVLKHGGAIVDEQFFEEGTNDFRMQLSGLRAKLIQRRRQKQAEDQGIDLATARYNARSDSALYADSTLEIAGLFIPAESEDVVLLSPQVFFHKIRTQMLGSTGWHNAKTLNDGKRYVTNTIISTNLEMENTNERWPWFRDAVKARFKSDATRVSAMGFDATELLLAAVKQVGSDRDPQKVARALAAVQGYNGVSGRVSFDSATGANTEAAIVKIAEKKFVRLQ